MKMEVLVGMIGSSKSTYARERARDGAMIVSHDDLTEMLHGGHEYFGHLRRCYQNMEEALVDVAIRNNCDVVIDRTHLTHESRKRWLEYALVHNHKFGRDRRLDIVAVAFRLESPKVHALRRFESDPRGLSYEEWFKVATKHFDQAMLSPLSEGEGFTRVEWKEFVGEEFRESSRDRVMSRVEAANEVMEERSFAAAEKVARQRAVADQERDRVAREVRLEEKSCAAPGPRPAPAAKLVPVPEPVIRPSPAPRPVAPRLPVPEVVPGPRHSFDLKALREKMSG